MSGWVRALAPAKVNLTLAVLARRPDGYHEIESWMLAVDLLDELRARATRTGAVRIAISGEAATADVPGDDTNLAVRAARAVLAAARERGLAGADVGLDLELAKSIPSRAGLGGGSSDAAAAWIAACKALDVALDDATAERELAALGSDCVFFEKAREGLGIATGRGERVERVALAPPRWSIALATPEVGAPTAAVYSRALPRAGTKPSLRPRITETASDARSSFDNDLESAALAAVPALRAWRSTLDECGLAHWRLCGSGSSWFGVHDSDGDARDALTLVRSTATRRGLALRLARVVHAAGHGAALVREK